MNMNLKKLKNTKITTSIILIYIISLLATLAVGPIGYTNTSKMYSINNALIKTITSISSILLTLIMIRYIFESKH